MRSIRLVPLLSPALASAHTTAGAHAHEGDLAGLLVIALLAGLAAWLDRRGGR